MTTIHIGMPKTGTTFLQRNLFHTREALAAHGVRYLNPCAALDEATSSTGKPVIAHHWLAHAMLGRRKSHTLVDDFSRLDAHVAALQAEIAAHPDHHCLLSSEEFSALKPAQIARLSGFFPGSRILIYLRRQDTWLDSFFAQAAKGGRGGISPEQLFEGQTWRLDYLAFLEPWAAVFGRQNIIVRTYEGFGSGTGMWDDFFAALGATQASAIQPLQEDANHSLSYEVTQFARAQHIHGEQPELRRMLVSINDAFPKRDGLKHVDAALARRILDFARESNAAVARRYLGRDRLFTDESIRIAEGCDEFSAEKLAQIVGGVSVQLLARISRLEKRNARLTERIDSLQSALTALRVESEARRLSALPGKVLGLLKASAGGRPVKARTATA